MRIPFRRRIAEIRLALVDADVARWLVPDGALSEDPLDGKLDGWRRDLRERRLQAVAALERAGGRDPHSAFLLPPTDVQRVFRSRAK